MMQPIGALDVEEQREPVPWGGLDVAILVYLWLCCQMLSSALAARPTTVGDQLVGGAVAMAAATSLGLAYLLRRGASWRALGLSGSDLLAHARLGAVACALAIVPLLGCAGLLDRLVPYRHPIIDFLLEHRGPRAILAVTLAAVVVAPVAEEFFFRRVLQGWLEKVWGPWPAILTSAVIFGLAHLGHGLGWIPLMGFGLVAGVLTRQTGSILPAIVLHALFNAASLALVVWQTAPAPAP
ncbi:MAG: lysostaphin resistance A-like protein [Planctomycetia bacterium]